MSECTHDCASCGSDCADRKGGIPKEKPHELSRIKKVIAIMSGKGGVGKSMVTSLLAAETNRKGYKTAILDADITGPSIPQAFGLTERAFCDEKGIMPVSSLGGVNIISLNLLLENTTDPVVWRGPVIAGVVKQFWTDVIWGDVDYMFIDLPPGTGDVPLTVFQSIPIDGIIVVTSPQELVSMIVEKAVNMAKMMNVPILGIVENMSYFRCNSCDKIHYIFGESHIEKTAKRFDITSICKLPINPDVSSAADRGQADAMSEPAVAPILDTIFALSKGEEE